MTWSAADAAANTCCCLRRQHQAGQIVISRTGTPLQQLPRGHRLPCVHLIAVNLQGELLLRTEELRDALWTICDVKHEEVEAARLKLANDGSAAEHVLLLGQHLTNLVQVEFDRWVLPSAL